MMSKARTQYALPSSGYRGENFDGGDGVLRRTYQALPAAEAPFTEYDYSILYEIIQLAEYQAQDDARKGAGAYRACLAGMQRAQHARRRSSRGMQCSAARWCSTHARGATCAAGGGPPRRPVPPRPTCAQARAT